MALIKALVNYAERRQFPPVPANTVGALPPTKAVFCKIQQIDISKVTSKKYFRSYNLTKNARESFLGKI